MLNTSLARRNFIKSSVLATIGTRLALVSGATVTALVIGGCNLFNDILNWVPVGEAAVDSVLSVLTGNGVMINPAMQAMIDTIKAAFAALTGAIKEYQATTPAPAGALAKIQTAFKDIVDNFSTFLASLNVSGGLLGIISGLAQVVFSTIAAFMNQLPAPVGGLRTSIVSSTVKVGSSSVAIVPKTRTRRGFKKDWNHTLDAGPTVSVVIPKSAYLKLSLFEHL